MSRAHKCDYDADGICRICAGVRPEQLDDRNSETVEEMLQVAKWEGRIKFIVGLLVGSGITLIICRWQ